MSGGLFEYNQCRLLDAITLLRNSIETIKKIRSGAEDNRFEFPEMTTDTLEKLEQGLKQLRIAYVYMQRIDWFLSYDDGEKEFSKRLNAALNREATGCPEADLCH
ncbi:hypothetical protein SAMN05192529_13224 [Arachidicoccus rhizosphaerae]|uniref:Uncharacterized protein n=1 Tax=Arachidicoccus rhizosphaerae TaxID=551991 RepID=A0A1H4CJJ8_9BACT|nr:hypothetical protein [Arachidicoccus rhizosphaerae]SEA60509.1 hypothetical protein SAMN05192529_13224 [Arachidicoccus rhizosphaerae]